MDGNQIGTILLHVPSNLTGLLANKREWEEHLDPANLQRYDLKQLKDVLGSLVLEIQSQLKKLEKGSSAGGQSGQGSGGMDVDE
jgi:hypothetical protein